MRVKVETVSQHCGLHSYYQNGKVVNAFIIYLETGRADSLKEAINLYEKEESERKRERAEAKHRSNMEQLAQQQMEKLNAIHQQSQRQADAAERTADAAQSTALWSGATAFMLSEEIERNK